MSTRHISSVLGFTLIAAATACGGDGDVSDAAIDLARAVSSHDEAALASCTTPVKPARELMVRALPVVEDPLRTTWTGSFANPSDGAWQFGRLMANMAGAVDPAVFVENWLKLWTVDQTINSFAVPNRSAGMHGRLLDTWPRRADGKLDLTRAPLRLLAIVNRLDLRDVAAGNAGEGRFVFGVLDADGNPQQFTVILEYRVPATNAAGVLAWAQKWHALGALDPSTEAYRAQLQDITDTFAKKGANPNNPNGSALGQLRTNEIALSSPWELREFHLAKAGLVESTVVRTPDASFDEGGANEKLLAAFVNNQEAAILDGSYDIPLSLRANSVRVPFRGGAIRNSIDFWSAAGIRNNAARHQLSLNTCNGCHGAETSTFFLQVNPRAAGEPAQLAGFLTGIDVLDPVDGSVHHFDDLARRKSDMTDVLCGTGAQLSPQARRTH